MNLTTPADWLYTAVDGYVINSKFSDQNSEKLEDIIKLISDRFGSSVCGMTKKSLHITLLD